jgi:hypothetical protein
MPIIWDFADQQDRNDYELIDQLRRQWRKARSREMWRRAGWSVIAIAYGSLTIYGAVMLCARVVQAYR